MGAEGGLERNSNSRVGLLDDGLDAWFPSKPARFIDGIPRMNDDLLGCRWARDGAELDGNWTRPDLCSNWTRSSAPTTLFCSTLFSTNTNQFDLLQPSRRSKVIKPNGAEADELENQVASYLTDLEASVAELKADLRGLQITGAKEVRTRRACEPSTWMR